MNNGKRFLKQGRYLMMGNVAMAEGALSAGLKFFGGYPITPSTEVIEHLSKRLPEVGGCCMQMEDELASINSVIGASLVGAKSMTATSGPGLSLMAETISMAANLEVPFVFCDVQRSGPGTGFVTVPHHNDIGLARFPGNGEFEVIAFAPISCQELFDLTITAFNYAETYRCPIFIMSDAYLGHLHEVVNIPPKNEILERVIKREIPEDIKGAKYTYQDTKTQEYVIPKPFIMGTKYCPPLVFQLPHNQDGILMPEENSLKFMKIMIDKIRDNMDEICITEEYKLDDAEIIIISYGLPVRACYNAVDLARKIGIKVGIFRLVTVWPFPEERVKKVVANAKAIIVPELNYTGVIAEQVQRVTKLDIPIYKIPSIVTLHHPDDILKTIKEASK